MRCLSSYSRHHQNERRAMSPESKKKVIIAYTGGATTSLCINYLSHDKNMTVIAYLANLGGRRNAHAIVADAYKLGASQVHITDLRSYFLKEVCFKAVRANAEFANGFYLARAMSSIPIIKGLVNIAVENNVMMAAHGCAVASNEQVRFENLLASLAPTVKFFSPPREWHWKTRDSIVEILRERLGSNAPGLSYMTQYAYDENIWGTTYSFGPLKDSWQSPPEDMFKTTMEPKKAPNKGEEIEIGFVSGIPVSLNGKDMDALELVEELTVITAEHGIGRADLVSDGLTGVKLREVCEYPAAKALYTAHRALELICLPQKVLQHSEVMSIRYGELIMQGDWYTTLREAIDSYFDVTQKRVSGTIRLMLRKGICTAVGRKSAQTMIAAPTEDYPTALDPKDLDGFTRVVALSNRIEALRNREVGEDEA